MTYTLVASLASQNSINGQRGLMSAFGNLPSSMYAQGYQVRRALSQLFERHSFIFDSVTYCLHSGNLSALLCVRDMRFT